MAKNKYRVVQYGFVDDAYQTQIAYSVDNTSRWIAKGLSYSEARRIAAALNRADGVCECHHTVHIDAYVNAYANAYGWTYCPWCGKKVAVKK